MSRCVHEKLCAVAGVVLLWAAPFAGALPPPLRSGVAVTTAYGIEFSTIGTPGNRAPNMTEAPRLFPPFSFPARSLGVVPYTYSIGRSEITASQWVEFVRAYAPYHDNDRDPYDPRFVSELVNVTTRGPGQTPTYEVPPEVANDAVTVGWDYAVRFCNWMTNGRGTTAAAFQTGAYDLTTITVGTNGHWNAVPTRLPTATYWLPSEDEWCKAAFYDPSRYGTGQEGYWMYPNASDTPLIPGWPEDGGQTDAGIPFPGPNDPWRENHVAAYPGVQSPWGLFDVSGGVTEWTDTSIAGLDSVRTKGTRLFEDASLLVDRDRISNGGSGYAVAGYAGIRLATSVPTPAAPLAVGMFSLCVRRTRRVAQVTAG